MELEFFIAKALEDIASGIAKGRVAAAENGVIIGQALYADPSRAIPTTRQNTTAIPEFIEFDIAVTVSKNVNAKAGLQVISINLGNVEGGASQMSVSRLRFKVPVHWEKEKPLRPVTAGQISTY